MNLRQIWQYSVHRAARRLLLVVMLGSSGASAQFELDKLDLRAQLAPKQHTQLSAEFGARIIHLPLAEGDRVSKGQLLVEFDCSLQRAQLRKSQAELSGAENQLAKNTRLSELGAIGAVELKSSQIEVSKIRADIDYLRTLLGKCRIESPFAGRIGSVSAQQQQFVQAGQPLIELFDDQQLELSFIVPSVWLAWFRPGYPLSVLIDETAQRYPAKLIRTAGQVDPVSQTVKAFAQIEGQYSELIPGMSGVLQIQKQAE